MKLNLKPLVPASDHDQGDAGGGSGQIPLDKNHARLKLKHLMSPLSPHLQKVREADKDTSRYTPNVTPPTAIPYDEPVVDELPAGSPQIKDDPVNLPPAPVPARKEDDPNSARNILMAGMRMNASPDQVAEPPKPAHPEETAQTAGADSPETEALISAPRKKTKLLKVAIAGVNILIILTAVQYFLDPLGLSIEPFEHKAPVLPNQARVDQSADAIANAIAPIKSFDDLESVSLEAFVDQLQGARIMTSTSPRGVVIDSIFYPEGSMLHPGLGLTVHSIEGSGSNSVLTVADPDGNTFHYTAN